MYTHVGFPEDFSAKELNQVVRYAGSIGDMDVTKASLAGQWPARVWWCDETWNRVATTPNGFQTIRGGIIGAQCKANIGARFEGASQKRAT